MAKRKVTKASKRRLAIFGTISFVIIAYFLFNVFHYSYSIYSLRKEEKQLKENLNQLKDDEENLKNEITKLKDPDYVARYARENYLYSKDGEYIIKMKPVPSKQEEEKTASDQPDIIKYGMIPIILGALMFVICVIKHYHSKKK